MHEMHVFAVLRGGVAMLESRNPETVTLGQFIRERRIELGLTQEQLAARVGENVRQAEISRLERDRVSLPRRGRMERLASALEVSLGTLLLRTGWLDEAEGACDAPVPIMHAATQFHAPFRKPVGSAVAEADESGDGGPDLLNNALSRARQVTRRTEDVLRESAITVDQARRTRRRHR